MKYLFTIAFSFFSASLMAQLDLVSKKDTIPKDAISGVRQKLNPLQQKLNPNAILWNKVDSLRQHSKLDSTQAQLKSNADSVGRTNPITTASHKIDSVGQKVQTPDKIVSNGIQSLSGNANHEIDSVGHTVTGFENKIEKYPGAIEHRGDSVERKINQLAKQPEQIEQKIQHKADIAEQKVTKGVANLESKASEKIKKVTGKTVTVPRTNVNPSTPNLNSSSPTLPKVDGVNLKTDLPNLQLPKTDNLVKDMPASQSLDVSKDVGKIKEEIKIPNLLKTELPVKELSEVKNATSNVTGELKAVDSKLAQGEKYEDALKNVKTQNANELAKEAETKLENVAPVNELKGQITKAEKIKAQQVELLQKYRDQKLLEAEIKRKASAVANDVMAQHAKEINQAQTILAQSKRGIHSIKSFRDVFKRRSDELVGKKFYQRLVPGVTMQTYSGAVVSTDLGIQLGYRLSPRFTAGVGYFGRFGINKKFDYYIQQVGVTGDRIYADLTALKGVFFHAEAYQLHLSKDRMLANQSNELKMTQAYGSYFGLGKKMNVSPHLKSTMIILYRVDYNGKLPSVSKFNVRIGFDYVFKKKKRYY